jgi:type III secretory pathway component EscU
MQPPPPGAVPLPPSPSDLRLAAQLLVTAVERADRSSLALLARTDKLIHTFSSAVDRFARQTRRETLSAVLLVALVAAAAAVLATLLTLGILAPRIGFLGMLRVLFRRG